MFLYSFNLSPPTCKLSPNCLSTLPIWPPLQACIARLSFHMTFFFFCLHPRILFANAGPCGSASSLFFIVLIGFCKYRWKLRKIYTTTTATSPPKSAYSILKHLHPGSHSSCYPYRNTSTQRESEGSLHAGQTPFAHALFSSIHFTCRIKKTVT